jgi:hypothetical protein
MNKARVCGEAESVFRFLKNENFNQVASPKLFSFSLIHKLILLLIFYIIKCGMVWNLIHTLTHRNGNCSSS